MAAQHTMASWEEPPLPRSFDSVFYGAAGGGEDLPSDDEFNRVSFLSHFEGANNGVNNAFDDGSADNLTITAVGNATQGSFGPFARPDGEFGVSFDGSGDYLQAANSADWDLGTGNFTWECYANINDITRTQWFFSVYTTSSGQNAWGLRLESDGTLNAYFSGDGSESPTAIGVAAASSGLTENAWHHIAVVKNGTGSSNIQVYVDGVSKVTGTFGAIFDTNLPFLVGRQGNATYTQYFLGQISNIRIIKGTALYTGNFTPSTSKLTAVTNTKLLTCQSNRFVDNSASGHTVTPSGNAAVSAFGPFLTSSVYDAAVNGASAYFDGSGDYLTTPYASSIANWYSTDYTIEAWVYYTAFTQSPAPGGHPNVLKHGQIGSANDYWSFGAIANGTLKFYYFNGAAIDTCVSTATLSLNTWHHIAMCHDDSDNEINLYLDGVSVKTHTVAGTPQSSSSSIIIMGEAQSSYFTGYMNDLRVINGTEVYTGNFTPPTAPLTAITNTKLLLNMADAQAIDSTAQNNFELVGNANVSTDQAKFGDTSFHVPASGDYLKMPGGTETGNFGTGNFTIEMWLYRTASGADQSIIDSRAAASAVDYQTHITSGNKLRSRYGGIAETSATVPVNEWVHIAIVRNNGTVTQYINGTGGGTYSSTASLTVTSSGLTLGGGANDSGSIAGYVDDIRISKMARYTSNFTAPSEPFADKGQ